MLRGLLNHVATLPLALLVIGLVICVAVGAVLVGRRLVPGVREGTWSHPAGSVLEVIGAMVGLLLAFAVVIQFQFYIEAVDDSRDEAARLSQLVRDARGFAPGDSLRVNAAVDAYTRAVVDDEWPSMRDGRSSPAAAARLDDLVAALQQADPGTGARRVFYEAAVSELNAVIGARLARIDRAEDGPPMLLVALLLVGVAVMLAYAMLVGARSRGFHFATAAALGTVVGITLLLFITFSYPFSGGISVDASVFEDHLATASANRP